MTCDAILFEKFLFEKIFSIKKKLCIISNCPEWKVLWKCLKLLRNWCKFSSNFQNSHSIYCCKQWSFPLRISLISVSKPTVISYVKSVSIRSFSGSYFPSLGLFPQRHFPRSHRRICSHFLKKSLMGNFSAKSIKLVRIQIMCSLSRKKKRKKNFHKLFWRLCLSFSLKLLST